METAFFVSIISLGLEVLVFLGTLIYVAFHVRDKGTWTGKLWWPVVISGFSGALAFLLSVRYVINEPRDQSWVMFAAISIVLPLLLAVVVSRTLKRQLRNWKTS